MNEDQGDISRYRWIVVHYTEDQEGKDIKDEDVLRIFTFRDTDTIGFTINCYYYK